MNPEPQHPHFCARCVMSVKDDPEITFDGKGVCSYCQAYDKQKDHQVAKTDLSKVIAEIKAAGNGKKYDCVVGISGGADSSYLLARAVELGLRPIAMHYDNGWNSELANHNIENLLTKLNVSLNTYVNDWEEFRDIQLSFLKAGVVDIELVTDQAILAALYKAAKKYKVSYIITGHNFSTESILPRHWYHWKTDVLNIKAIHRRFGDVKMKTYPTLSFMRQLLNDKYKWVRMVSLLNYLDYDKDSAKEYLNKNYGWRDYGGKHFESIFTRFYQGYILPTKFGIDKRTAHLSSLINSRQMSREDALKVLVKPPYPLEHLEEDRRFVIKKLGLSDEQFREIMSQPVKSHTDYPSYITRHYRFLRFLGKQAG
jgi:N-acetyl sugar amidotransferase